MRTLHLMLYPLSVVLALSVSLSACDDTNDAAADAEADATADSTPADTKGDTSDAASDATADTDASQQDTGGTDTSESDADAPDSQSDATDATEQDGETEDGGELDVTTDTSDTSDTSDTTVDTVECAYVCAIDCICQVDENGCDLPACAESCDELSAVAHAELASAGAGCDGPDSCQWYEFPICGTFGCFQGATADGADTSALDVAANAAGQAGCEPFHCGCGFPEGTPVCLQEQCRLCPPDCGSSCDELAYAVTAFATESAKGCESDEDCAITPVGTCDLGPFVSCHGLAWNQNADDAKALIDGFVANPECGAMECDCQAEQAYCKGGYCVPQYGVLDSMNCGTVDEGFPFLSKSCSADADCVVALHQINCCGTFEARGIAKSAYQMFDVAEQICQATLFGCGCASEPTKADDGNTAWEGGAFAVQCQEGQCRSYVK